MLTQASFTDIFVVLAVAGVVWIFVGRVKEARAIHALGTRAPTIQGYLPLGIDHLTTILWNSYRNRNIESWFKWFHSSPSLTLEKTILGRRCIMTADPENIKAILATRFENFGKGEPFHEEWKTLLGDSIFSTDGSLWRDSRKMIKSLFIKDRVHDLEVFEKHFQVFLEVVGKEGRIVGVTTCDADLESGKRGGSAGNVIEIDLKDVIYRYTLDVATDFLIGQDVGSLKKPRMEFERAFEEVQHIQSVISRSGPANPLIPRKRMNEGIEAMDRFMLPFIASVLELKKSEKVEKSDNSYTFLHALAEATNNPRTLRDHLTSILIAGRDTTASAITWTFYELGRHPDVFRKLRKEILNSFGKDSIPTYAELKDLRYLQMVLSEVLRLYPIIPFNYRLALRDTTLPCGGGPNGDQPIGVLKDTPVFYSPYFLHRHSKTYTDQICNLQEFSPERWESWHPKPWTYIPFNGGPRICIGQQFALAEMGYTVTRVLQRYSGLETVVKRGKEECRKCEITLRLDDGVTFRLWEDNE